VVRALVLNATYEALCVISTHRAIVLVLNERAELLEGSGSFFHSPTMDIEVPSVIRLRQYVKVPIFPKIALSKRAIFARDHSTCQYCGEPAENVDHIVPRSRGGLHVWENVVASCEPCNARKEDRLLAETNFTLRSRPIQPRGRSWVISIGPTRPEWSTYLRAGVARDEARSA
jgi:5-methylcytosine-specific restriction endonuclease McrA